MFNRYDRARFHNRDSLERSRTFSPAIPPRVLTTFREDNSSSGKIIQSKDSETDTEYLEDIELGWHLPHIPLRPFRNQVGGHSTIYKLTKRAVCKVSVLLCLFVFPFDLSSPLHFGLWIMIPIVASR